MVATADLWFDPVCPWAWLVSRWLTEVERVRDVQMRLHVMSLSVLNEDRPDLTDAEHAGLHDAWALVRLVMATSLSLGGQAVRDLYTALGQLIHVDHMTMSRDTLALALGRAGLPHSLANAAQDPHYDAAVRASHHAGVDPLGDVAACPVLHVAGPGGEPIAFMGPLVTPYPRGEAAGRLWDAVALAAATDGFFGLRRLLTQEPVFD
jgi:mycothiol-dependent nitroreductase-like protein